MTIDDVKNRIAEIVEWLSWGDNEVAHIKEDELLKDVLRVVGSSKTDPYEARKLALITLRLVNSLKYDRWYGSSLFGG